MRNQLRIGCALLLGMAAGHEQSTIAGWTGQMNGAGFGKAGVNVTSGTGVPGAANMTVAAFGPSASMAPALGFKANAPLPTGANAATVSRVAGRPGYIWSASTFATGGDRTDNAEIESRTTIIPALEAYLEINSTAFIDENNRSGVIYVNARASQGAALLVRGYEWMGEGDPEDLEDLKANSVLKWEMMLPGPFDLTDTQEGCNALVIPFSVESSVEKLYFVTDGVALSKPNEPPVPSATTLVIGSGVIATLAATDGYTPVDEIKIWVKDSATPNFQAGPFKAGDKIFLRKNPNQPPYARPLSPPYAAQVQTKGKALLVGEDALGARTNPGVPVP